MPKEKKFQLMVSASSALTLASFLLKHGYCEAQLEQELSMPLNDLEKPDQRIPLHQYAHMWEQALILSGDPALGLHLGEKPQEEGMGVVGHIFFNNATLGKALTQFTRLYTLVNEGIRAEFETDEQRAYLRYVWDCPDAYSVPIMERTMAVSITRAKKLIHPQLKMEFVAFAHNAPEYTAEYERIFACPIRFGEEHCCIAFKKNFLDYPLPQRNPYLHQVLTRHVENLLSKLRPQRTLAQQVQDLVNKQLAKNAFDAERIAKKLNMSRHTLYRKLKAEGHSYQELVEAVRQKKAMFYLKQNKYSLSEIAFLLGFSELSAFSRAFKRWTGQSPAQFQKDNAQL
ncbi:AraC family transcriptional regulator [Oleiphilus messinensis]|nr:AraC family transcriptional regulator ligand-binding domain-containing protein [Oleiphilus messinensis]